MTEDRDQPAPAARLYVEHALAPGTSVTLAPGQAHHVATVLRLGRDAPVVLFNGRDGAYRSRLTRVQRQRSDAVCEAWLGGPERGCDVWLLAPPLKKQRQDVLVEKTAELGAGALWPVFTERTQAGRVRADRLRDQLIAATQQSERCTVPELMTPSNLTQVLADWPAERRLIVPVARGDAPPLPEILAFESRANRGAHAILIGPEGGFSAAELDRLAACTFVRRASLGPRVMRAETAALAALACYQASPLGDWTDHDEIR